MMSCDGHSNFKMSSIPEIKITRTDSYLQDESAKDGSDSKQASINDGVGEPCKAKMSETSMKSDHFKPPATV